MMFKLPKIKFTHTRWHKPLLYDLVSYRTCRKVAITIATSSVKLNNTTLQPLFLKWIISKLNSILNSIEAGC